MDAAEALADLLEISSHIEAAVLFEQGGGVTASTLGDDVAAAALARSCVDLIGAADRLRASGPAVTRVEASFREGSLFVVRDGERLVGATTVPSPPAALVLYDLRTVLTSTAPEPPKQRRRASPRSKKAQDADVAS